MKKGVLSMASSPASWTCTVSRGCWPRAGEHSSGDAGRAARVLRDGDGLWRGRPLADLEFELFARIDVERLEELRLVAREERIESALALGRQRPLIPELEALVAQHPLREQLLLALYRSGRQADALEAYRDARSALSGRSAAPFR